MANVAIYGIKNCSTMKKAFDKLGELGVAYEFFDYKKQPTHTSQIQKWADNIGLDKVLNKKGTTWRNLTDEQKQSAQTSEHNAIGLMAAYPTLIKRPIIELEKNGEMQYLVGFNAGEYAQVFRE